MKKSLFIFALAAVLVFAFATAAFATSAKTWNYSTDYYTWGSTPGSGVSVLEADMLKNVGANAANPGAHGNYLANTAKCGICHSVHRAKGDGVKLLNTTVATCAGCHKAGTATATDVVINWQASGADQRPHNAGNDANCTQRTCHVNNPHGANGSQYAIVAAKLLSANTDAVFTAALADTAASGITLADLNATGGTWDEAKRSLVRTGYNCNQAGCHVQTLLAVVNEGWAESRYDNYNTNHGYADKTGHLGQVAAGTTLTLSGQQRAFAPVDSCISCHDQTDAATLNANGSTVSGFTFPHGQTPLGASNTGAGRAYLWMGYAAKTGDALTAVGATQKAYDGTCLKCHRDASGASGVGLTF